MHCVFACAFPPLKWRETGRFKMLWRQLPQLLEKSNADGLIELFQYNCGIKHTLRTSMVSILRTMAREGMGIPAATIDRFEGQWEITQVVKHVLPYYESSADSNAHPGVVDPSVVLPIASHIFSTRMHALIDEELGSANVAGELRNENLATEVRNVTVDEDDGEARLLRVFDQLDSDMRERFPPCVADTCFLEPMSITVLAEYVEDKIMSTP